MAAHHSLHGCVRCESPLLPRAVGETDEDARTAGGWFSREASQEPLAVGKVLKGRERAGGPGPEGEGESRWARS
eukprot:scaffold19838_cov39-Isochrysis_galbana.AAC.1